jgi:DNA polymerase-3 subunit epsilon
VSLLILGLDFESGGSFDKPLEENFITEVGAVLWSVEKKTPVRMMNVLVNQDREIYPEATEYTGIDNEMVKEHGVPLDSALKGLMKMYSLADFIVAQNGLMFDKPLLNQELYASGMGELKSYGTKLWLDTTCDVSYPANCRNTNLTYLAGFHLILNCFPHRAVTDVLTMLTVLSRYDINEVIRNASEPTYLVRAMTNFDQKELAKKAGFYWEPKDKLWLKNMRKSKYEQSKGGWDFEHKIVKEEIREGAISESNQQQY